MNTNTHPHRISTQYTHTHLIVRFPNMNFQPMYADPATLAPMLCSQIEHYFSTENLVRDIYLRQRMDVEGYVPCAMLFDFPRVQAMCYSIDYLMAACANSKLIQVDSQNEKVRLRNGWDKWLYPAPDGQMGVPLYKKFPRAPSPLLQQMNTMASVNGMQNVNGIEELSSSGSSSDNESEPAMSAPPTPSRKSLSSDNDSKMSLKSLSVDAAEWTPA